jgi:hypothetical protein
VEILIVILTLALLALVVRFIAGPLRGHGGGGAHPRADAEAGRELAGELRLAGELQALEAAREAKYREIRDCELDFRTGKLSREDYEAIDAQLRAEAIEILDRLERSRPA